MGVWELANECMGQLPQAELQLVSLVQLHNVCM